MLDETNSPVTEADPESTPETGGDLAPTTAPAAEAPTPEVADLEALERFKFAGKEWTPKELRDQYLSSFEARQQVEQFKQEERFKENLPYDLEAIRQDPSKIAKFKEIYPEKFHKYVQSYESRIPAPNGDQKTYAEAIDRIARLEADLNDRRNAAAESQLDSVISKMTSKYKHADTDAVLAKADLLLTHKRKSEGSKAAISDTEWEALFKDNHSRIESIAKQIHASRVNEQKQANSKGRDVAPGGGTPGTAPKLPKTIREASTHALQELENY